MLPLSNKNTTSKRLLIIPTRYSKTARYLDVFLMIISSLCVCIYLSWIRLKQIENLTLIMMRKRCGKIFLKPACSVRVLLETVRASLHFCIKKKNILSWWWFFEKWVASMNHNLLQISLFLILFIIIIIFWCQRIIVLFYFT